MTQLLQNGGPDSLAPVEAERGTDVFAILRTLRKRWMLVVAITAAIALAVTFYTLGQKKIYQSSATMLFDPTPPRPLGRQVETVVDMSTGSYWNNKEYYETQYELMKSLRLALAVVQELGLQNDLAFLQNAPPGGKTVEPREMPTAEQAAQTLLSRVSVAPVKNSRLAKLTYLDADPARAQRIATAMAETFVALNLSDAQQSTGSAVEWLNGQLDKLRDGLDASEMALHNYKLDKNILSVDIDGQSHMLRAEMEQLSQALTTARIKREELAARHAELSKVGADDPSQLPATELLQSLVLQRLRESYVTALRERDALHASGKGENHPNVRAADGSVTTSRAALLAEIRNIQGSVARDLAIVRKQEAGLSGLLAAAKKQGFDLNLLAIEYNRLNRTKENSEKLYSVVLERTKEGDLARMLQVNNIRVAEAPLLPRGPIKPRVPVNVLLGMVAGLVLGVGAAFAREFVDRSVKTQADLEGLLGLTFLGLIPAISPDGAKKAKYYGYGRKRRRAKADDGAPVSPDLIVHQAPLSGPAEAARAIRTNLRFMSPDEPFRVLLVTSASPSEGKTTVAANIAVVMAQAGQKVLLLDADLRKPRIHRIFGKPSDVGLTVAMLDPGVLTDELLATDIPDLCVLVAGPIPPNPAELLQSDKFATLLEGLRNRFDRIVIDSPPVGPVTDAAVLATQVDGTVLVVRAFKTSRETVADAKRTLQNVGGRVVGAVLNAVDLERSEYKGYYQYAYYRKGGYYRSQPESPSRPSTS
ncbi:MAG: polysaccharide biosynthesis tyrosine autokinase [Polyangiaceae bacterium]|nr:polysaccharide biosynthesis tyrosine autokinase [Polyangiaceae bacterium]